MTEQTNARVTFETKCWEGDWTFLLNGGRLRMMIERNDHDFAVRRLVINNVSNFDAVCRAADKLVAADILTEFVVVRDIEQDALDHFNLTREGLGAGYYYSVAELVGLFVCDTEYLLHYSGDAHPDRTIHWIPLAIDAMQKKPEVAASNLCWNGNYDEARNESFAETPDFLVGYGFSDQCYLVKTAEFRRQIYGERNDVSDERYPSYGGELFEKRVDAWMRNTKRTRLTYKHGTYVHKNFPKAPWRRCLLQLTDRLSYGRL